MLLVVAAISFLTGYVARQNSEAVREAQGAQQCERPAKSRKVD